MFEEQHTSIIHFQYQQKFFIDYSYRRTFIIIKFKLFVCNDYDGDNKDFQDELYDAVLGIWTKIVEPRNLWFVLASIRLVGTNSQILAEQSG